MFSEGIVLEWNIVSSQARSPQRLDPSCPHLRQTHTAVATALHVRHLHASPPAPQTDASEGALPCVMVFNANDPSGAGGLSADLTAMSSASAHVLAVVTGTYVRDTTEIHDHFAFDEEAVTDQARCALEDMPVQAFKVGFVGSPENLSAIASHHHRLRPDSGDHLHARSVVVGRAGHRHLPRRLHRIAAAPDHGAGGQPQHLVPLAAARLGR